MLCAGVTFQLALVCARKFRPKKTKKNQQLENSELCVKQDGLAGWMHYTTIRMHFL